MELNKKYPRTYHLPFSPGTTSDDKKLRSDWFKDYEGKETIVIRTVEGFSFEENGEEAFPHHVCKWVRPHHVQTDVFWTRNWHRAKLVYETRANTNNTEEV